MRPHHDRQQSGKEAPGPAGRTPRRRGPRSRAWDRWPSLEHLEPRVVLSPTIFTVNSTGNTSLGSGTSGTLPYVISQANANMNTQGSEIQFDSSVFSTPRTITLAATLVLSEKSGPEVIDGPGANLVTVSGGGKSGCSRSRAGLRHRSRG